MKNVEKNYFKSFQFSFVSIKIHCRKNDRNLNIQLAMEQILRRKKKTNNL